MKTLSAFLFSAVFVVAGASATLADSMASAAPSGMMMKPSCAAGDPVVGVNTNTKMYMTSDQMHAKSAGMTASQKQAMMSKNHVTMMCKSKADAMGAKMMGSAPSKM